MGQLEVRNFFKNNWEKILIAFLFVVTFVCIGLLFGLKENVHHQDALFKGNANKVTLKRVTDKLLYTYDITSTPLAGVDKFTGNFNIEIVSPGIPNVRFRVEDDAGRTISSDTYYVNNMTDVPFTSVSSTRSLKLFVTSNTDNNVLNSINVFINYSKTRY